MKTTHMPDESVDRILETLTQVTVSLEGLRVTVMSVSDACHDHESRLRSIEMWKHNITPFFAVLTFALGAIFSIAIERML